MKKQLTQPQVGKKLLAELILIGGLTLALVVGSVSSSAGTRNNTSYAKKLNTEILIELTTQLKTDPKWITTQYETVLDDWSKHQCMEAVSLSVCIPLPDSFDSQTESLAARILPLEEQSYQITRSRLKCYALKKLTVRIEPFKDADVLTSVAENDEVKVIGTVDGTRFVQIKYNDTIGFVNSKYLTTKKPKIKIESVTPKWEGEILSKSRGAVMGPSGKETYYNLNMSRIVEIMHDKGFEGDYWVRDDGCKMLGDYIMVAADFNTRPRGTLIETSLGIGIVCDTGTFAKTNPTQLDIATNW